MNAKNLAVVSLAGAGLVVAYELSWLGESRLAPVLVGLGVSVGLLGVAFLTLLKHPGDALAKILRAAEVVDWDIVGGGEKGEAVINLRRANVVLVDTETGHQTAIGPGSIRLTASDHSSGRETLAYSFALFGRVPVQWG